MLIVGESLNGAIPSVAQAIATRDESRIAALARRQVKCGAQMLDVNAGGAGGQDECDDLTWLLTTVQEAVQVPLLLDSSNPNALRAAMAICQGLRPILSLATLEEDRLETLLDMAVEYGCGLVVLCMDDRGIPMEPLERLEIAGELIQCACDPGVFPGYPHDLWGQQQAQSWDPVIQVR